MKAVDFLRKAKSLITDPDNWSQVSYARSADGAKCNINSPEASRWCAAGAVVRACGHYSAIPSMELLGKAADKLGGGGVVILNDSADHATVMRMFDIAIEMAEAGR